MNRWIRFTTLHDEISIGHELVFGGFMLFLRRLLNILLDRFGDRLRINQELFGWLLSRLFRRLLRFSSNELFWCVFVRSLLWKLWIQQSLLLDTRLMTGKSWLRLLSWSLRLNLRLQFNFSSIVIFNNWFIIFLLHTLRRLFDLVFLVFFFLIFFTLRLLHVNILVLIWMLRFLVFIVLIIVLVLLLLRLVINFFVVV